VRAEHAAERVVHCKRATVWGACAHTMRLKTGARFPAVQLLQVIDGGNERPMIEVKWRGQQHVSDHAALLLLRGAACSGAARLCSGGASGRCLRPCLLPRRQPVRA
jgi:hypothetical protein